MRYTLGHTGLLPFFAARTFSAEDVAQPKPAPDLFLLAASSMNAKPDTCVVIEDSASGVTAAKAAGMFVCGYAAMGQGQKLRAAGADLIFDDMSKFTEILRTAGAAQQHPLKPFS